MSKKEYIKQQKEEERELQKKADREYKEYLKEKKREEKKLRD